MNLFDIIFLAFALSIDAMAVSFSHGLLCVKNKRINAFLISLFTGFFQFLMPVAGYFFASLIYDIVSPFSSLIASLIFLVLGLKFIYDSFFESQKESTFCCISLSCLLVLSFATSIDALAAGVNLRFLNSAILYPSCIIGLVTFINAFLGFFLGHLLKKFPSKYLQIIAGFVLLALAYKSFFGFVLH